MEGTGKYWNEEATFDPENEVFCIAKVASESFGS
jgi:hypothetical protein